LLFNLANDPGETTDLSGKDPEKLQDMLAKLERTLAGAKD
jgi:hypothetical protein